MATEALRERAKERIGGKKQELGRRRSRVVVRPTGHLERENVDASCLSVANLRKVEGLRRARQ